MNVHIENWKKELEHLLNFVDDRSELIMQTGLPLPATESNAQRYTVVVTIITFHPLLGARVEVILVSYCLELQFNFVWSTKVNHFIIFISWLLYIFVYIVFLACESFFGFNESGI